MNSRVHLRRVGGASFQVQLHDFSARGCRVELIEAPDIGETVITRFPQLEPIGAKVRWAKSTIAGVEFVRPIHPAVFDHVIGKMRVA